MCILKNGGSATDAVEAAIKLLEDREITNAGYGSNLAMDGVVECDASIVDHLGRSGAVGAVARRLHMSCWKQRLTVLYRDQKPHIIGTHDIRAYKQTTYAASRAAEPAVLSRGHRICSRARHAHPSP